MPRRTATAVLLTATVALTLLTATACSSDADPSVNTKPDKATAAVSTAPTTAPPTTTPAPAPTVAMVGQTITVTGQDGEKLAITLKRWSTTIKSTNEYDAPEPGKVWTGGQFEIRNTGTVLYDDTPDNCVQAADSAGEHFTSAYVGDITAGPTMATGLKLPPGDVALGWMAFEVPKGTTIAKIQYTPNSGFGEHTAQWAIA